MKMDKMTNNFIDKADVHLIDGHRFDELARKLANYQGVDILPFTENNELITGEMRTQAMQRHERLLSQNPKPAACVLILLTNEENSKLLLTRRSSQLSSHAGEVSFVGGKRDETDGSSADVALREAFEEVGLNRQSATILGYLPMQFSKKGLLVRPVIASISADVVGRLIASKDEIARLFWLPLALLFNQPVDYVFDRQLPNTTKLHTPAWVYDVDGDGRVEVIWGLTGRILANFLEIGFGVRHEWYYRVQK